MRKADWWRKWDVDTGALPPCPVNRPGIYELWNGQRVAIHRIGASSVMARVPMPDGGERTIFWRTQDGTLITTRVPPHYRIRRRLPWANLDGSINYPTRRPVVVQDEEGRVRIVDAAETPPSRLKPGRSVPNTI